MTNDVPSFYSQLSIVLPSRDRADSSAPPLFNCLLFYSLAKRTPSPAKWDILGYIVIFSRLESIKPPKTGYTGDQGPTRRPAMKTCSICWGLIV